MANSAKINEKELAAIPLTSFEPLEKSTVEKREEIVMPSLTFMQDSWRRLKKNKAAKELSTKTIIVPAIASLLVGQVTLLISCFTCRKNILGLVLAIKSFFHNFLFAHYYINDSENRLAGVTGIEPVAPGFGDRCSTN